jgi:spore maturation protein CgeB
MIERRRIVILGLSITSTWGNGHATTYRGLVRELSRRGHQVLFLERDMSWYAANRDLPRPPDGTTALYRSLDELRDVHGRSIREADVVIVGSYVPDGIEVGQWVCSTAQGMTAFYDIDTPVTLAALAAGTCTYLSPALIRQYRLYLSFTGGPTLALLERDYGADAARPLYCSFDPDAYYSEPWPTQWDLGYMGTYCVTRQPSLDRLMLSAADLMPAQRFAVAGPGYPDDVQWPANVERIENVPASGHRRFYNSQRFTLNLTRGDMIRAGYSPSVRLFEAAACGVPIISDYWTGLETLFRPGIEVLISESPRDTRRFLSELPEAERCAIATRACRRVRAEHTAEHRAIQLEEYLIEARARRSRVAGPSQPPAVTNSASELAGSRGRLFLGSRPCRPCHLSVAAI